MNDASLRIYPFVTQDTRHIFIVLTHLLTDRDWEKATKFLILFTPTETANFL